MYGQLKTASVIPQWDRDQIDEVIRTLELRDVEARRDENQREKATQLERLKALRDRA